VSRLRDLLGRLHLRSVQADEYEGEGRRDIDNVDALAAGIGTEKLDVFGEGGPGTIPPNYVKSYDDGRPRH
jgi:hypothetical protein